MRKERYDVQLDAKAKKDALNHLKTTIKDHDTQVSGLKKNN